MFNGALPHNGKKALIMVSLNREAPIWTPKYHSAHTEDTQKRYLEPWGYIQFRLLRRIP